eukprot:CAMPEP_0184501776 /NCGR_PEP_ID=MMETSP0113_2-20130426/48517_1 /TAXON_ID=91329 /ORGANISM="Norrisiella sphaerica, Strain BC52" /LENGTH=356 /DNA_ID=CAMNT_0026890657 /DNA_START=99 /DNA_END=1169 /DNA_ORIENTATION=-
MNVKAAAFRPKAATDVDTKSDTDVSSSTGVAAPLSDPGPSGSRGRGRGSVRNKARGASRKSASHLPQQQGHEMQTSAKKIHAYAVDCEMIVVYMPDGKLQQAVVSIGVVDEGMEVILYARVRKPANSMVVNDTFVKTAGGLTADYDKGLSIFSARELVTRLVQEGATIVGWQIDNDLKALGVDRVVPTHQIVDLTKQFVTANGHKCKLIEAYRSVFRRNFPAHNAGDDAKVTMELYHYWNEAAKGQIVRIDLNFFCINWHYFKLGSTGMSRGDVLWKFLRPRTNDRDVVIEEDDGKNAYKLKFRLKADRDAYVLMVKRRLEENNIFPQGKLIRVAGGRGTEIDFGFFRSHVYEIVR